ncbi:chromate transporter [Streptomyces shaanxiensis]|uniref:Uncharacterized protein n=1 Tax=Streptomyces shaanxiensis TaxID=653357 RepID=A0ABP7UD24_9ACTN
MLQPGPEAHAAGTLFVLPRVLALLALSALYVGFGTTAAVTGLFAGLAPAVVVIVAQAVWRVGRRTSRILLVGLLLWVVPVVAVAVLTGTGSVFTIQAHLRALFLFILLGAPISRTAWYCGVHWMPGTG